MGREGRKAADTARPFLARRRAQGSMVQAAVQVSLANCPTRPVGTWPSVAAQTPFQHQLPRETTACSACAAAWCCSS